MKKTMEEKEAVSTKIRYLPISHNHGGPVLEHLREKHYRVNNRLGIRVDYRFSKEFEDRATGEWVNNGDDVVGTDEGDGWIKVEAVF